MCLSVNYINWNQNLSVNSSPVSNVASSLSTWLHGYQENNNNTQWCMLIILRYNPNFMPTFWNNQLEYFIYMTGCAPLMIRKSYKLVPFYFPFCQYYVLVLLFEFILIVLYTMNILCFTYFIKSHFSHEDCPLQLERL